MRFVIASLTASILVVPALPLAGEESMMPMIPPMPGGVPASAPASQRVRPPQPASRRALQFGEVPPALEATDLQGKAVRLADLVGQPVVLQFGSLTEPAFRQHAAAVEKLAATYAGKVRFVVIYTAESHAADGPDRLDVNVTDGYNLAAPATLQERFSVARRAGRELGLAHQTMLVDAWNDSTAKRYHRWPNMTFVLDREGKLQAVYPWMDETKVQAALEDLLAGRPVADVHRGPTTQGASAAAQARTGDGGASVVAAVLDTMELSDPQQQAIQTAMTHYFADLQAMGTVSAARAPVDETAVEKAKASASALRAVLRQQLPADEQAQLLEALRQGPGRRFFLDE